MTHSMSGPSGPWDTLLPLGSDLIIATAYIAISITLGVFVYHARRALPFHWMFTAFGAFILGCGGTHIMHVLARLGLENVWLTGWIQVITMIASFGVAVALPPLLPRALALIEAAQRDVQHRAQLTHQATHDTLTGLPNRALFLDRLGHALQRAPRLGQTHAVLFVDLDGFKAVNDTCGHAAGDRVLVGTAERLHSCVRAEDTIGRLGGDEFVILLEDVEGLDAACLVAERLGSALMRPFLVAGGEVMVTASIGISLGTSPTDRPEDLLRFADLAMYQAKSGGKAAYEIYRPSAPSSPSEAASPSGVMVTSGAPASI